jgi:cytochrome c oxidase subunit 3
MSERIAGSALASQFDDLPQQQRADTLGIWVFLASELLFFSGMFLVYGIYRIRDEAVFAAASNHLDELWGAINTGVLLCSSLTMVLAVHAAESSRRTQLIWLLLATILLGSLFLGIKGYEYYSKYEHGLMPLGGLPFVYDGPSPDRARMFFVLYFVMTGVHALHMLIGLVILSCLLFLAWRGKLLGQFASPVHVTGLYWHFVDMIWVFLFPLLYLIGVR